MLKIDAGCPVYMSYVARHNEVVGVCKKHHIERAEPESAIVRSMKGWEPIDPAHRPQVVTAPQAQRWEWKRISKHNQVKFLRREICPYNTNTLSTTLMNEAGIDAAGLLELRYMEPDIDMALDSRDSPKQSYHADYT